MSIVTSAVVTAIIVVLAVSIGLIASSLRKLTSKEVGLQYDVHQHKLDDEVYNVGLHLGPPGYKFIIFPKVYKTMEFSQVTCLNHDGLTIKLSVQFQYLVSLKKVDLKKVIMQFEDHKNYLEIMEDAAQAVIHDACSEFNVNQFQTSRVQFQKLILKYLKEKMLREFLTNVRDVQVSNIQRPSAYEQAVKDKEATKQNIDIAVEERPRILTAAKTKLKEAETEANITFSKAEADARISMTKAYAESEAILNAYETEAQTYKMIMDGQNLTVPGLLSYLTTRALQASKTKLYVNLPAPAKTTFP